MSDRVWYAAKSDSDKVVDLLKAISIGREPPPTEEEWVSLRDYWLGKLGRRRRGHHKSMTRYRQGLDRHMLRGMMEFIRPLVRKDPAERDLKRTIRRDGGRYNLNEQVARHMHKRLTSFSGRKNVPTVEYLVNILKRSTAADEDVPFGFEWLPYIELD